MPIWMWLLIVLAVGAILAGVIRLNILEEREEEGGSPDDPHGGESYPLMQDDPRQDGLTVVDGRPTRRCGDPMPACGTRKAS